MHSANPIIEFLYALNPSAVDFIPTLFGFCPLNIVSGILDNFFVGYIVI